jgi:3-methyladenine DNA glycosylase AlkD
MTPGAKTALRLSAGAFAARMRADLRRGGDAGIAHGVQRYFREKVTAHGWKTPALRRYARSVRKEILAAGGEALVFDVAERLFPSRVLEESAAGSFLLEPAARKMTPADFRRLERWLPHLHNWAMCDELGLGVLAHIVAAHPRETVPRVLRWADKRDRWQRRIACVALIRLARRGEQTSAIFRLCDKLLDDRDDMVEKAAGWLLRELSRDHPRLSVPYLLRIKPRASRFVLRTACETLSPRERARVLA